MKIFTALIVGIVLGDIAHARVVLSSLDEKVLAGTFAEIPDDQARLNDVMNDIESMRNRNWNALANVETPEIKAISLIKTGHADKVSTADLDKMHPLWRGRVLFMLGKDQDAMSEFSRIPLTDHSFYQAQLEMALAAVANQQLRKAIGILHVLTSPYFKLEVRAPLYYSLGIAYLQLCQYGEADHWFREADQDVKARHRAWTDLGNMPDSFLLNEIRKTLSSRAGKHNLTLRKILVKGPLLSSLVDWNHSLNRFEDVETRIFRLGQRQAFWKHRIRVLEIQLEDDRFTSPVEKRIHEERLWAHRSFFTDFNQKSQDQMVILENAKKLLLADMNVKQKTFLSRARLMIREYGTDLNTMGVNIELARAESRLLFARNDDFKSVGDQTTARNLPVKSTSMKEVKWPFELELWGDELGNYYSSAGDRCEKRFSDEQKEMIRKDLISALMGEEVINVGGN